MLKRGTKKDNLEIQIIARKYLTDGEYKKLEDEFRKKNGLNRPVISRRFATDKETKKFHDEFKKKNGMSINEYHNLMYKEMFGQIEKKELLDIYKPFIDIKNRKKPIKNKLK